MKPILDRMMQEVFEYQEKKIYMLEEKIKQLEKEKKDLIGTLELISFKCGHKL